MRSRSLLIAAVVLTVVSGALWGAAIADMWDVIPDFVVPLDRTAAATTAIVAVMCWITRGSRRRDESRELLIDTVVNLTRPAARRTGPLRRVQ